MYEELDRAISGQKLILLTMEPEAVDFTIGEGGRFVIRSQSGEASIPFTREDAHVAHALLEVCLEERTAITWNVKGIATMFRAYCDRDIPAPEAIKDLRHPERFSAISGKAPSSLQEAIGRWKAVSEGEDWRNSYRRVYAPLATKVVPCLEAIGLVEASGKRLVHAYYDIDGQLNGRMKCHVAYTRGFNPHTLGESPDIRPPHGHRFIAFDISNNEPAVLAWMSKDLLLSRAMEGDAYSNIWEAIFETKASPARRKMCKSIFLPVVYGMGAASLARELEIEEKNARKIIDKIGARFPRAMKYVTADSMASSGVIRDHFGRSRRFEGDLYRCRNFLVQSPSSYICLERLVRLGGAVSGVARLAFHVHDGYFLISPQKHCERAFDLAKDSLESESDLCPGLALKAVGSIGDRLDELAPPTAV